jgi:2-keto-4-pentenoate hydratase/2-oxohepta-3-ene-1,7-dioic acid hydratase in catechol pathway
MQLIRFLFNGSIHQGQLAPDGTHARVVESPLFGSEPTQLTARADAPILKIDKLLAPLIPTDILCIGWNYREHVAEGKGDVPVNPLLFIKGSNTLNNPFDPIAIPQRSKQIDYEGELAIVIARPAKNVPKARALDYVLGYTIANDITARDWQRDKALGGGQFARGKSFDGFCPLGPSIVTADEIPNPNALRIRTLLNDRVMQDATTADMIFDVPTLIESLSSTMTLRPGSIILTGTPPGVGFARTPPIWLKPGDNIAVEIERLGRLENPIVDEIGT